MIFFCFPSFAFACLSRFCCRNPDFTSQCLQFTKLQGHLQKFVASQLHAIGTNIPAVSILLTQADQAMYGHEPVFAYCDIKTGLLLILVCLRMCVQGK